jgi:hypothetical protein
MWKTRTWVVAMQVDGEMPEEYKPIAYAELRRKLSNELYEVLEQSRNPAVVEVSELRVEKLSPTFEALAYSGCPIPYHERISYEVKVTPVRYQHVEMQKMEPFDWFRKPPKEATFWQKTKWLFTGKIDD